MDRTVFGFDLDAAWDYENGFYLTSAPYRISNCIGHYELYKRIIDLPGHVVELGVFKGASMIRFLSFRDMLENEVSRKVIGFDSFAEFPESSLSLDKEFVDNWRDAVGDSISESELRKILKHKGFSNYELVSGNIKETVPMYLRNHPELKISLLHLDVDVYDPSKIALEYMYSHLVIGGLLVLDDYGTVYGETLAVDEFFRGMEIRFKKLPLAHIPAYHVKEREV